jgi:hypothetical protein
VGGKESNSDSLLGPTTSKTVREREREEGQGEGEGEGSIYRDGEKRERQRETFFYDTKTVVSLSSPPP